ncbi:MAG: hypothetical protein IPJ82_10760 [Lewinellaceae bacterium]|nr:hypothetical protein [Lewinellaceae bacterium]
MCVLLSLFMCFSSLALTAQSPAAPSPSVQQQALQEIKRRGLSEIEVRARLQQKGIDMDSITPEQLPELQDTIQQVLSELESEKAKKIQANLPPPTVSTSGNISRDKAEQIRQDARQPDTANATTLPDSPGASDSLPPVKVWGQHLFRDKSLAVFRTTTDAKPPDNYVLSTGDIIVISIFGPSPIRQPV